MEWAKPQRMNTGTPNTNGSIFPLRANGVGKATEDEHGHTQHQWQHLPLAGELDSRRHDETAADSQEETCPGPFRQTTCEDLGSRLHTIGLGIGNEPRREQTTYNIAEKHRQQHRPVALTTKVF